MTSLHSRYTPVSRIVSVVLTGVAATVPSWVLAAETGESGKLEEVMVTATRHGETDLQKTPVAVTAINSEDLSRLAGKDITGIAADVPNFSASRMSLVKIEEVSPCGTLF